MFFTSTCHIELTSTLHSTPIQLKIYAEDFEQIIGNIPFLKGRLESNEPSRIIRKIVHKVRPSPKLSLEAICSQSLRRSPSLTKLSSQTQRRSRETSSFSSPNSTSRWTGTASQRPTPTTTSAPRIQMVRRPGAVGTIPSQQGCCVRSSTSKSSRMTQLSVLTLQADARNLSLTTLLPSTMMKLRQGELRLNDNTGDPKFPAFLYDEDAMDGTFTTGLLCGPLLLAVSSESVTTKTDVTHGRHLGIYFHLYFTFWRDRRKGVVQAREHQNPQNGKGHPLDDLLRSNSCLC